MKLIEQTSQERFWKFTREQLAKLRESTLSRSLDEIRMERSEQAVILFC